MAITALPSPPSRQDPTNFAAKSDALIGALPNFVTQVNATSAELNTKYDAAMAAGLPNAAANASSAAASEVAAAASYAAFSSRFLGPKTADPTVDNVGNALAVGALYFNTVTMETKVWNGSAWQNPALIGGTISTLTVNADATINTVRAGRGGGSVSSNTVLGFAALNANTTGGANTAVGTNTLDLNTTESNNTAVGFNALTTATAANNTAIGSLALQFATTGQGNVALGATALRTLTTGQNNTCVGRSAGENILTGSNNTVLGRYNGNQNGLDISAANNYVVLSDGNGLLKMVFNSSGQSAIGGAVPSAWGNATSSLGPNAFSTLSSSGTYGIALHYNNYFDNTNYKYQQTDAAGIFEVQAGNFRWKSAPVGTAGNNITFSTPMTLVQSTNDLLLGTTTDNPLGSNITTIVMDGATGSGIRLKQAGVDRATFYSAGNEVYTGNATATGGFHTIMNNVERQIITSGGFTKASNTGKCSSTNSLNFVY